MWVENYSSQFWEYKQIADEKLRKTRDRSSDLHAVEHIHKEKDLDIYLDFSLNFDKHKLRFLIALLNPFVLINHDYIR